MSLRTRLILAFFTLSVVPLAAVTFYAYTANVAALREAAEREADLLAGELGQRMELVTAQLSERVEHLMDIAELQAAAEAAQQDAAARTSTPTEVTLITPVTPVTTVPASSPAALNDYIAKSLGEAAMLLNNVELQNMRVGGRGGRGGPPPPGVPPVPGVVPAPAVAGTTGSSRPGGSAPAGATTGGSGRSGDTRTRGTRPPPPPPGEPPQGTRVAPRSRTTSIGPTPGAPAGTTQSQETPTPTPPPTAAAAGVPTAPVTPPVPPAPPVVSKVDPSGKLTIDMGPIRREMFRQILPEGRTENLTLEERQRVAAEINQRMLGIAQGIQIGAAEVQKRAEAAQREAAAKAAQTAKPTPSSSGPRTVAVSNLTRRSSLSGSRIDVKVERNGEVVRQMNAEINLPNVLATVFSTTKSERGEVPFAVAKDGVIYTRTDADKPRVAAFGDVAKADGPATARLNDWVIVTTQDKSGSGLKLGIARPVSDSLATLRIAAARNAGLGLLFIVVMLVGIVPLSTRLTRDLTTLGAAVSRIAQGDYAARVPVKAHDEFGQLAAAFNKMAGDVERHQQTAVEQERIRRELELGRQIQNEMLPHAPLNLGLTQVNGVSVPAREVGGDFFNYFVLDNGQVALLMGDVSGKGVGAALLMANIQASLRIRLDLGQDLAAVTDAIDRDIEANSPGAVYATLFIGVMDPASRILRYVNAGHNPQYVLRLTGGLQRMGATGLPVGLLAGRGYKEERVQLSAGDLLFLYTDGCVEVENEAGDMFGSERLEPLLLSAVTATDALRLIERGISEFRGSAEPLDDATLMTVKVG